MKFITYNLLHSLLFILVLALFAMCFAPTYWLADLTVHFTMQYAVVSLITFAGLCLMRAKLWQILLSGFICMVFSLHVGCLFLPRHITRSDLYEDVTLLQFNVYYGNSNMDNFVSWLDHYAAVEENIDGRVQLSFPDIIVLQEVTPEIAKKLGALEKWYPYHLSCPRKDTFGSVIYSRIPMKEQVREALSDSGNQYSHIEFVTPIRRFAIHMNELHTMSPTSSTHQMQRNAELKEITVVSNQLPDSSKILVGDMNITPYSSHFWQMERNTRLNNAMQGKSIAGTWPSFLPAALRIPIDQMLVSDNIEVLARQVKQFAGSDHLPVMTKLRIYATN